MRDHDLLIVGGGPVGLSLACACSGLGLRLALVEQKPKAESTLMRTKDPKAIALSFSSQRFFEALGIWPHLAPFTCPIKSVHVSEKGALGRTILKPSDVGLSQIEVLGNVIQADQLQAVLEGIVNQLPDVTRFYDMSITQHQDLPNPLIVAADGSHSALRESAGLPTTKTHYQETAIVAYADLERDHNGMAFERFTPEGPIALLPFGEKAAKVVWILPTETAKQRLAEDEPSFQQALQAAFGLHTPIGQFLKITHRSSYPLQGIVAEQPFCNRLVLVGNAATTLHPIAAQGLNLALRDVARLAETLYQAKRLGQPIGAKSTLAKYARWRSADYQRVSQATHQLHKVFQTPLKPLRTVRRLSLLLLNQVPPLKRHITELGMGLIPDLPKLSRGLSLAPVLSA